jgi:HNH endonuclease
MLNTAPLQVYNVTPFIGVLYMPAKCCVEGCSNQVKAKGLCAAHYVRARRGLDLSLPLTRTGTDAERLKLKTKINIETGCWEWTASLNTNGYGQFRINGTTEQAHRASWMIFKGPIPQDDSAYGTMNVLHKCDNPLCVNPEHLFLGDQSDNANDAVSKGRWGKRGMIGEKHGRALLTEEQVRMIRASSESAEVLATALKVSKSAILHVRNRRTWTHIQE